MGSRRANATISDLEGFAQLLALEAAALKGDLSQDPQWCEQTRSRLLAVWGGEISPDDFLDQLVHTVIFASLLAKTSEHREVSEINLEEFLPPNIPVLSELVRMLLLHFKEDSRSSTAFSRLIRIINNQPATPLIPTEIPPSVYFYEHFLKAFSIKSRRERGTFYTPPEIVEFIVKGVQQILQKDLGIAGLCDSHTRLLDFSAGTGAFLLGAIKLALREIMPQSNQHAIIRDKIIPHFAGLEPYLAPNVVAQLNLVKLLQDPPIKYSFSAKDHFNLHPLDTLEDPEKNEIFATGFPSAKSIPIIIGNPPYVADSQNNSSWILGLIGSYKEGLLEKNLKPLNDDYIKFLRYAQWRVEQAGQGIIGIITNNSFLDGIVHRVMRASLLRTFNKLYLLNLHGHQREDGDESVFDIQKVGVAICLFVKILNAPEKKEIFYFSSLDQCLKSRAAKLDFLRTHQLETIPWKRLEVYAPHYWFKPQSSQEEETYLAGWSLDEIFEVYTSGIETGNDNFYISLPTEKETLVSRIRDALLSQDESAIKKKYDWLETTNQTFQKLRAHGLPDTILNAIYPLHYRPLDVRWCYYERGAMSRDRYEVMQHLIGNQDPNLALISVRQVGGQDSFTHVLVTGMITDNRIMKSTKGKAYVFPLFRREGVKRIPNFRPEFLQGLAKLYGKVPDVEDIFAYLYAILNSPGYRQRYAVLLRKNFPRVPVIRDLHQFEVIAMQGKLLIDAHLLRSPPTMLPGVIFRGQTPPLITKKHIRYDSVTQRLFFNNEQYLEEISPDIWNFHIGGWQVLSHWLSERDGKKFERAEQEQFGQILHALVASQNFARNLADLFKLR